MPEKTIDVAIREHKVAKQTRWGEVEKSLNQDMVFVNGELAGYYSHVSKKFLPLAGWDNEMSEPVLKAIATLKDETPAGAVTAPPIQLPKPAEEGSDDE